MADESEDIQDKLKKFKPKKKKMTVPKEFLEGANSYDDKLVLVKTITEREKQRVVLLFKKMLAEDKPKKR
jgi:hypothetical protein